MAPILVLNIEGVVSRGAPASVTTGGSPSGIVARLHDYSTSMYSSRVSTIVLTNISSLMKVSISINSTSSSKCYRSASKSSDQRPDCRSPPSTSSIDTPKICVGMVCITLYIGYRFRVKNLSFSPVHPYLPVPCTVFVGNAFQY